MRERVLSLGGVAALCALAWAYLLTEASSMQGMPEMPGMEDMSGMSAMAGMGGTWDPTELGYLCVMWSIMMVAMMLPSALPTLLLVARIDRTRAARGSGGDARRAALGVTPPFVAGYLAAWSAYSILAATVQWTLHGLLLVSPAMVSVSPLLSGGILIAAGIY